MAHPSPSPPSGSRRLSELLEQQQEPFSLDLFLLEKGCPPAFLDAAAGCTCATPTCWPSSSSSTSRTLWRPAASKRPRIGRVLGLLLSNILRGSTAAAKKKKKQQQLHRAAIDWGCVDGENRKLPGHAGNAAATTPPSPSPGAVAEADVEDAGVEQEKQLSPVSVLEQRLFEQSPPAHAQKALVIFRELLHAAYTPPLLGLLAGASTPATAMAAPPRDARARWEGLLEEELARVTDLITSEMGAAGAWLPTGEEQRRDVGADIAAAVLEALAEETAAELMGMGRDRLVDTARRRCWC